MSQDKRKKGAGDTIIGDLTPFSRREFLKTSVLLSSYLAAGAAGAEIMPGCSDPGGWEPVSFPKVLLRNLRLFDGASDRLGDGLMVLIEGGRISAVEPEGDTSAYRDYTVIDLGGRTLLPGLIDNHVHMTVPFMYDINLKAFEQMNRQIAINFRNCVMSGVTTVRDVGGFPGKINKYREMTDAGEIPGPRVISSLSPIAARSGDTLGAPAQAPYFSNPIITGILGGNYAERPTNVAEIRAACEKLIELGAQWLKTLHQDHTHTYSSLPLPNHSDEGYKAIIDIGKAHGIKCALHAPFITGFRKGVELGYHTLEHIPDDAVIPDGDVDRFIQKGMAMMPTMMVYGDAFLTDELIDMIERRADEYLVPEAARQALKSLKLSSLVKRENSTDVYLRDTFPNAVANLKKMHAMGAIVGAGSDIGGTKTGFFGRFADELKHYAAAGIPNSRVLAMATSINSRIIDMQEEIGAVKKGMRADIIAVDGDPLRDLGALDAVALVLKGGIFMKSPEGLSKEKSARVGV